MEVVSPSSVTQEDLDWTVGRLAQLADEGRAEQLEKALKAAVRGLGQTPAEKPAHERTKRTEVSPSDGG
jgi:plasmid stabilization system protein ParE